MTAWATVAREHPDWQLRIFGDGPLSGACGRQIDTLGLHDCVQLNGNSQYLAEEWAKASIATLTSRNEAFGLVLAEAQAAGVPVVSYDSPNGPREVVIDGQTGILVPPGDTDALASALMLLIRDTELRGRMGPRPSPRPTASLRGGDRHLGAPVPRAGGGARQWPSRRRQGRTAGRARRPQRPRRHCPRGRSGPRQHGAHLGPARPGSTPAQAAQTGERRRADLPAVGVGIPWDAVQQNLALAADVLEGADIPYFVVRDHLVRHTVAVHAMYREAVFKALADRYARDAVYAAVLNEGQNTVATVLAGHVAAYTDMPSAGVRVYRNLVSPSRTLRLGAVYGCTISFWDTDPDDESGSHLKAPRAPSSVTGCPTPRCGAAPAPWAAARTPRSSPSAVCSTATSGSPWTPSTPG